MSRPNRLQSLTELMADLETGRVSSVEATEACPRSAEAWQPRINAFIRIDGDAAMDAARTADSARRDGDMRPLLGAPLAHKDMFLRKGETSSGAAVSSFPTVSEPFIIGRRRSSSRSCPPFPPEIT